MEFVTIFNRLAYNSRMKSKGFLTSGMKLHREIILQTLSGYAEVNQIVENERCARLRTRTDHESLAIFAELYGTWECTAKIGQWERLTQRRIQDHVLLRAAFETAARKGGNL